MPDNLKKDKKIAIMQPYLFPYIGYFQLVHSSDNFVLYDDVTFIKGGFIHRNNILVNGKKYRFTLPVQGASSNIKIKDLKFTNNVRKLEQTFQQAYSKAPFYKDVYPIIDSVLNTSERGIVYICKSGIEKIFQYLGKDLAIKISSKLIYNRALPSKDRLIAITKLLDSSIYINSIGGLSLYDRQYFSNNGVKLYFLQPQEIDYQQSQNLFVSQLSIIDILMWNSKPEVLKMLEEYELV